MGADTIITGLFTLDGIIAGDDAEAIVKSAQ